MPLYEYYCEPCDDSTLTLRSIVHRDSAHYCPECGTLTRRTITAPELIKIQGGTRNHQKIKSVPIETRLNSKYGDNP